MPDETSQPNPETGASPNLESAKSHAKDAAAELRAAAEAKAQEFRSAAESKVHEFRERAEQTYEDARARSRTFQEDGEAYIRENPTKAVATALAAGFVLGLILRR